MAKRFGKKAEIRSILWIIMEICLVAVIFLAFAIKLSDFKDNLLFDKIYLSKDLGLMVDAIYASPGELSYVYSGKINNYSVSFDGGIVSVFKEQLADPQKFPYITDSGMKTDFVYSYLSVINNSDINFKKSGNSLVVSGGNVTFISDTLACSEALNTRFIKGIDGIVIDPSYSGTFPGKDDEANKTWAVAHLILALIVPSPISITRDNNVEASVDSRILRTEGKAFSISLMLHDSADVDILVKDDSLKSKKLACLLINELSKIEGFKRGTIEISGEPMIVNNKADVPVAIVFDKSFAFDDAERRKEFAEDVKSALEAYYG
jgi:hypothetical protein